MKVWQKRPPPPPPPYQTTNPSSSFFFLSLFFWFVFSNLSQDKPKNLCKFQHYTTFHRQTQQLMQISTLHNFPETNPTTYANFKTSQSSTDKTQNSMQISKNCTICHRQTQKLMQILKLHNLPQIKPKTQCKFQKLHNLPQTNPKNLCKF